MIRVGKIVEVLEEYRVLILILRAELLVWSPTRLSIVASSSDSAATHFLVYF